MVRTQTGFRCREAQCGWCGSSSGTLRNCSRCGLVRYCSRECQREAFPGHKILCKMSGEAFERTDENGRRRILYDKTFGGAYSLLAAAQRSPGIVLAELSHKASDFCGRRRDRSPRSIRLSHVDATALVPLLACNQHPSLPELALRAADTFCTNIDRSSVTVVALREEGRLDFYLMAMWLGPTHPAHAYFRDALGSPAPVILWDEQEPRDKRDALAQWLYRNAVGSQFYLSCSLEWDRLHTGEVDPRTCLDMSPPVACNVDARSCATTGADACLIYRRIAPTTKARKHQDPKTGRSLDPNYQNRHISEEEHRSHVACAKSVSAALARQS